MAAPNIPNFEILETMPRGGMSTVYKARQISLDRIVALKTLPPHLAADSADIDKFIAEARTTANLKHPNIVQVYDFGKSEEGIYYFVMEFVSGYSVADWIRRKGGISEDNALLVAQSIAEALGYAWTRAGIIHCDIKPDNIIIDGDGTVKVADLGLAKSVRSVVDKDKTATGMVFGTPNYISPEQSRGDVELDCRADIYSLGAMLYHCVTGRMPFEGRPLMDVMDLQITDRIPDPQDVNARVSTEVTCLIETMMAKDRAHRPPDWTAVADDLERVLHHQMPQCELPPGADSTIQRSAQRGTRPRPQPEEAAPPGALTQAIRQVSEAGHRTPLARPAVKTPAPVRRGMRPERVVAGILVAAIVVLAGLMTYSLRRGARGTASAVAPTAGHPTTSAATTGRVEAARESNAKDMFDFALTWVEANSNRYDEAIRKFENVAQETKGTRYSLMASDEIQKLRARKTQALDTVMHGLRDQANALVGRGQYADAAQLYEHYQGPWAGETAAARQAKAKEWHDRARAYQEEQRQQAEVAAQQWRALLNDVAGDLAKNEPTAALERVKRSATGTPPAAAHAADLAGLQTLLAEATRLEQRLLDSFRAQKDQEVTVQLAKGPEKITIRNVQHDAIQAEKILTVGAGHVSQPKTLRLADLAAAEKRARLGPDDTPAGALLHGLLALREGDRKAAADAFAKTTPLLAEPLAAALQNEPTAGKEDPTPPAPPAKAHDDEPPSPPPGAPPETSGQTPPPDPSPTPSPAGPAANPDAVRAQLVERNPGLNDFQIRMKLDAQNQLARVEIYSPVLKDIRPLTGQTALRGVVLAPLAPGEWCDPYPTLPLEDLTPLKGLPLRELTLGPSRVRELQPLSGMPLTSLNVAASKIRDMRVLKGMPLETLDISRTDIMELTALVGMKLTMLNAAMTKIRDLMALREMPLKDLQLGHTEITDIGMLKGMPLETLNVEHTHVREIAALTGMTSLQQVNLSHTDIKDVAALRGLGLKSLNLGFTRVGDAGPLSGMPLRTLSLEATDVKDGAVLRTLPLKELNLGSTKIKDLTVLQELPLVALNISNISLKDLTFLRNMPLGFLNICGTGVKDIRPLQGLPIEEIYLDFHPFQPNNDTHWAFKEVLQRMPRLKKINDIPLFEMREKREGRGR